ncbi:MAG: ATP-binding cassette domain-containing protein [Rickettsiales bacterium]|nr:ATP-binding cassette domain-containing protein [Rickettsiales bacterium]MCA0254386.1 ATP-binding cassette domain-containing protein [Pseudomonadota bacterium]
MSNSYKFQIKSLYKSFGTHSVLKGVELDVIKDSSLIILGGSGSGKSVLIKSMVGLIHPDSGSILYEGVESIGMSSQERLKMLENCGYLFQAGALFDSLTVSQNITFFAEKLHNLSKKQCKELAKIKLESVGLSQRIIDLYPSELSGGMQKRVSLARAICTDPKVIFFDEPTTGLDPIMSNVINDLIIKVRDELGATTITITHDMQSARKIGKEVAFLYDGKIVWSGKMAEIDKTDNPQLKQFISGSAN